MLDGKVGKVEKLETMIAKQQKQIEALTAQLREQAQTFTAQLNEQAGQVQKVSAQLATASPSRGGLEVSKRAPQVVNNP
jgi:ABC-type transporter Mla subunit MlaD